MRRRRVSQLFQLAVLHLHLLQLPARLHEFRLQRAVLIYQPLLLCHRRRRRHIFRRRRLLTQERGPCIHRHRLTSAPRFDLRLELLDMRLIRVNLGMCFSNELTQLVGRQLGIDARIVFDRLGSHTKS